jgi:ubiquitin C-terminal hydrolase
MQFDDSNGKDAFPFVLPVYIDRFRASRIQSHFGFDDNISVDDFCKSTAAKVPSLKFRPEAKHNYALRTVIVHDGTLSSGHYTCYKGVVDDRPARPLKWYAHQLNSPLHSLTVYDMEAFVQ